MNAKPRIVFIFSFVHFLCSAGPGPLFKFIQNKNQWPSSIDFNAQVPGGNLSIGSGKFIYTFLDEEQLEELHEQSHYSFEEVKSTLKVGEKINAHRLETSFVRSNKNVRPEPFGQFPENYNFFLGSDTSHWASGVNAFEGMLYRSLYAGVDLKVYSLGQNLKYDFIVATGSDPSKIIIDYSGSEGISLENGDAIIKTSLGDVIEKKPIAYQVINGQRVLVPCEFYLCDSQLTFNFPTGYDSCEVLIIDPLLIFSTYSGSKADNWGSTATPGEKGNLYSAGVTNRFYGTNSFSGEFTVTPGAFQTTTGGFYDVGILKYDSAGQKLLYASYLGGAANESAHSLVVNSGGDLIILGTTSSLNFPTTNTAFDKTYNGGEREANVVEYVNGSDIFIARINKDGTKLIASTYLGGSANDGLNPYVSVLSANYGDELRGDVIADSDGNIYVSTVTSSANFPVANGFNLTYKGGSTDALVLKINSSLSAILWASFLGGSGSDATHTIKFDKQGNLFVAGGTASSNFPVTAGAYQELFGGNVDGWISNIANNGSAIISSTYTGTSTFNQIYFIDLNQQDEVYVYGQTTGAFPITSGTYRNPGGGQFIQKFNHTLSQLIFSTVIGSGRGLPDISPTAFLVNDCNNIYLTGWGGIVNQNTFNWNSDTSGMPISTDAFQKTTSGSDFYFMVLTDDAKEFLYGTYMGGTSSRTHVDGGTSRFDKKGVVYHAVCSGCRAYNALNAPTSDFPTSATAWSKKNGSLNCNNAAFKFDLSSLRARIQTNSVKLNSPGLSIVCLPDKMVFQNRSTGGEIYQWDFGDNTQVNATDTMAITHQYKDTGKYTVKLKALDAGTCIGKDSTAVTVHVFNHLGKAGEDGTICYGSPFQLTASGGVSYTWEDLKSDFKSSNANLAVSPLKDTSYKIAITDIQGCVFQDTVLVKIVPNIELEYDVQRIFNCYERPVVSVTNLTDKSEETYWDFGDGNTSDLDEDTHSFQKDGLYSIRLIGKKEFCIYQKQFDLPFFTFFAPNVITPDSPEGKNDTFQVLYGGKTPAEQNVKVSLIVNNRWGKVVYEEENYNNQWSGDGLAAGVYYYEVSVDGDATCRGWVQIIR